MTRALLAVVLILGHVPVAAARTRAVRHSSPYVPPAAIVAAAQQAAQAAMDSGVPAVQIAVWHRDRIIYSAAFGVTDKINATAATPRSVMQIGSVTKQFTAAAILRLAERGALTLDDPIQKYVPEFDTSGATITLRRLMSHTAGIPLSWQLPGTGSFGPATRAQVIQSLNQQPLNFPPGAGWSYSNAGYMLLGYAIESVTGKSFADFIHEEFALPLGLIDTGVCGTHNLPLPEGYGGLVPGLSTMKPPHPSAVWSSGSFCSTASDLARWAHLLATGYVMLPSSYVTMTTPARLANNALVGNGYALGVVRQPILGHPAVWHGGAIEGYQSFLLYLTDRDIAIAVVINAYPAKTAGDPQLIALAVAKAALATTLP
ncbi:MAG TPA: serine hydrolase domain-containing protein [Thermoanaerobaculia bacterium]|nr:serine hydrolase domain-containing protein [Thermoanaerobaculia bacterium]